MRRLWDSWEDGAEIRDAATNRFLDRDKIHHIDFAGRFFSVRGPGIVPRPPQGQPLVVALAHARAAYELAARATDVVFVTPHDARDVPSILAEVRAAERAVGRTGPPLTVLADLVVVLDADPSVAAHRLRRLEEAEPLRSDARVRQVILGAYFPGVNHDTVWSDPASGSHIDFASFEHWARTAERGTFDLLFLAEGLRLRTRGGQVFDQDVVGRPDTSPCSRRSPRSRSTSGSAGRSTRRSTSRTSWPASSRRWSSCPAAGPRGTS